MPVIKLKVYDTTRILIQEINQDLFDFQSTLHFRHTPGNLNKSDNNLTLERPSASIDAFEVFNFLYLHRILIFFPKAFGHFLCYCNVEFVCFLRVLRIKQQI